MGQTTTTPNKQDSYQDFFLKYAVISTLTTVVIGIVFIIISSFMFPDFNWVTRTLSNLGNPTRGFDSPSLFNASYIIAGMGSFPLYLYLAHEYQSSTHKLLRVGWKLLLFPPWLIAALGVASEQWIVLHMVFSNLFFLLWGLGVLFLACSWLKVEGERKWARFNFIVLFTAVGMWLVYFIFLQNTRINQALFEFASVIYYAILASAFSYKALKHDLKT